MSTRTASQWLAAVGAGEGSLEGSDDQAAARAAAKAMAADNFKFTTESIGKLRETPQLQAVAFALENAVSAALAEEAPSTASFGAWNEQAEAVIEAYRARDGVVVGDPGVASARRAQKALEASLTLARAPVKPGPAKTNVALPIAAVVLAIVAIGLNLSNRPAEPTERPLSAYSSVVIEVTAKAVEGDKVVLTVNDSWWKKDSLKRAQDLSALRVVLTGERAAGLELRHADGTVVGGWRGTAPFLEDPIAKLLEEQAAATAARSAANKDSLAASAPASVIPVAQPERGGGAYVALSATNLAALGAPAPTDEVKAQALAIARAQAETNAADGATPAEPTDADLRFYVPASWVQAGGSK